MKLRNHTTSLLTVLCGLTAASFAQASSHREAPAISNDPAADNTDLYAWVCDQDGTKALCIVANYNPLELPEGGPNYAKFSDDVLYQLHITHNDKMGKPSLEDFVTVDVRFKTATAPRVAVDNKGAGPGGGKEFFAQLSGQQQTYTVTRVDKKGTSVVAKDVRVAPVNIGPTTNAVVYKPQSGKYDDAYASGFIFPLANNQGRVWAGPRDDGFYVDLARVFDLAHLLDGTATDGVSGFNCHAIALEIPTASLTADGQPPKAGASDDNTIGVWASASRRKFSIIRRNGETEGYGPWTQVSRQGLPLINEAVIGLQDKDKYNRTRPNTDVANFGAYFLNPVIVRDAEAVGIYKALNVPQGTVDALKSNRLDVIDTINLRASGHNIPLEVTGDVLRVDLGLDSAFPNGRSLEGGAAPNKEPADVTDVLLSVLLSKGTVAVSDGVGSNDKPFLTEFPYLALPWEGFSQGHGKPAP